MIVIIITIDDTITEVVEDINTTSTGMIDMTHRQLSNMSRQQRRLSHKRANVQIPVGIPGDKK